MTAVLVFAIWIAVSFVPVVAACRQQERSVARAEWRGAL